jgi:hypothetical protein
MRILLITLFFRQNITPEQRITLWVKEEATELEEIYDNLITTRSDVVKPPLKEQ